ncbi:MAG: hypothetical protein JWM31_1601, partial [Solirubrobacterales bacterium]|nr:hypothetical protein [Solirubrobacterales bacterium]
KELGIAVRPVTPEEWQAAMVAAVGARSREQVAREVAAALDLTVTGAQEPLFTAAPPQA